MTPDARGRKLCGMDIRRLSSDDIGLLERAYVAFRGLDDTPDPAFLIDPANVAFVALEGEDVIGWSWGHELHRPNGDRTLLLYEVDVLEEHRRQGVGRALLDAFVRHARDLGHAKMWLFTDAGNDAAQRLYEGAGGIPGPKVGYWWIFE